MSADLKYEYHVALQRLNYTQSQIDLLRDAARNYPTIPQSLTNKQLLLFLSKCMGDVDKTLELLAKHYEIKRKAPQLFRHRDVRTSELRQSLENQYFFNLPQTRDCTICYFALQNSNSKNFNYNASTTCFLMMMEAALSKYGPSKGLILVYDMKNFRLGHLTRNNLKSMKSFFAYMQEGMPLNVEEIHIFNTFSSFNVVMKLISPFMRAEILKKMHLHTASIDLEKFHANHVAKNCLPSDDEYGGDLETVNEIHRQHCDELLDMREYFLTEEKMIFEDK